MKREFMKHISDEMKLEWQMTLVVMLALLTMAVMSSYIDSARTAAEEGAAVPAQGGTNQSHAAETDEADQHEGILRFHVIANSDSKEDQALKLKVRDSVLAKVQDRLADCFAKELKTEPGTKTLEAQRAELTESWVKDHLKEIEGWAAEVIEEEGYDYDVTANLGVRWIPEKEYDGIWFPAGNYEALNIVIGTGAGQNWWCVIFPPLCLIEGSNEEEAARLEEVYGEKVVLKSRILELLGWGEDREEGAEEESEEGAPTETGERPDTFQKIS